MNTRGLAEEMGKVAQKLMRDPACSAVADAKSCVRREELRPLTAAEKKKGWARRPFDHYDDSKLCNACSAYWHASVAQVRLFEIARREAVFGEEPAAVVVRGVREIPIVDKPLHLDIELASSHRSEAAAINAAYAVGAQFIVYQAVGGQQVWWVCVDRRGAAETERSG